MTPELKLLLNEKKRAFRAGDKEELRRVQRDLKYKIRSGRKSIRRKMEEQLQQNKVRNQLKKTKIRKAAGPDGISSRLLRDCADQLCQVVLHIFNLSLSLERVHELWKTSCVVPVPNIARPREPNQYRPVALTSLLMKTMERLNFFLPSLSIHWGRCSYPCSLMMEMQ